MKVFKKNSSDSLILWDQEQWMICYWAKSLCFTVTFILLSPKMRRAPGTERVITEYVLRSSNSEEREASWEPSALWRGPTHCITRVQDLSTNVIHTVLQELQRDIAFPQVINYSIQLITAERAAEVSKHFNMPLLKLLSSKRESYHVKKSFSEITS